MKISQLKAKFLRLPKGEVFGRLSLRGRLALLLSVVMLMAALFSGMLVLQQHRIAVQGADAAIFAHEEVVRTGQMRETLAEIDRASRAGEVPTQAVTRFRQLLDEEEKNLKDSSALRLLSSLRSRFDLYAAGLGGAPYFAHYDDVAAEVAALFEYRQHSVYQMAERLRRERERSVRTAVIFLLAFAGVLMIGGYKLISIITQPLSSFASFLDRVDLEDGLALEMPPVPRLLPEVALLASSFERLMERLKGFRAINVRRLLSEKQRADILAASITDGLILLRGDEVVYANPVGERILGISGIGQSFSFGRAALKRRYRLSQMARGAQNGSGPQAVWLAVQQTIPVEFALELEERKLHYLIQSAQIPYDLIHQEELDHLGGGAPAGADADEPFRANTLIVAQDVSLVRDSQAAKSHFLATLSHEVKTPVTSLTMATRLLKRSIDQFENPAHRQLIQTCADDVDRLRSLLEDLLTVSRLDTLAQRLAVQNVDFIRLVRTSVQSFQVTAHERSIELAWSITGEQRRIVIPMDPTKIAWALSNLLTNALRHTPRGGRVVVRVEGDENWVKVSVRDTGPGIERKRLERIFDKFNPFYDLRIARSGSVGAGLAIAREIVTAHGGRIWATSEPGQGAEFSFALPTRMPEAPSESGPGLTVGLAQRMMDSSKKGAENSGTPSRSG